MQLIKHHATPKKRYKSHKTLQIKHTNLKKIQIKNHTNLRKRYKSHKTLQIKKYTTHQKPFTKLIRNDINLTKHFGKKPHTTHKKLYKIVHISQDRTNRKPYTSQIISEYMDLLKMMYLYVIFL